MKIIGLTGGIASGKSSVAKMFAAQGATILSADEDARAVLAIGSPALEEVFTLFPEAKREDNTLDRAALATRIFANTEDKARLEAITHPAIIQKMREAIETAHHSGSFGVLAYEVPLLYERDLAPLFDAVVAVLATPELQAERLQAREAAAGRPALSQNAIAERLAAQMPPEEKAKRADYVIRTDSSLTSTEQQVQAVWDSLGAL